MTRKILINIFLIVMLAACSPLAALTSPIRVPTVPRDPAVKPIPVDRTPAQITAIQALSAKQSIPVGDIQVVRTEAVAWADGCLGVHLPGVLCTRGPVQGFRILLSAGGKQYEYHTNQDGSSILSAENRLGPTPAGG